MKDDEKKGGCAFSGTVKEDLLRRWGEVDMPTTTPEQSEEYIRLIREQSTFLRGKPTVHYFDAWWVRLHQRVRDLLSGGSR